jgi:hypothetical protein
MRAFAVLCSMLALAACTAQPRSKPTPLEIQSIQSKEFEADKNVAFGAVVSVFQDSGYIVESADKDTGFITASSPAGEKTAFWEALLGVSTSGQTKATAFVEQIRPSFVTVRLNFVNTRRSHNSNGQVTDHDTPLLDPAVYQVAFDKIDSAIFVRMGSRSVEPAQAPPTAASSK